MTSHRIAGLLVLCLLVACDGPRPASGGASPEGRDVHDQHAGHAGHEGHEGHQGHAGHEPIPARSPQLDTSLFQLTSRFTDLDGQPFALERLRGDPSLIVMFYGTCTTLCPVLVDDAKAITTAIAADERAHLRVVLVTFDPERDTPDRLRALATDHGLDLAHTTFLRAASDSDLRELSAVLGVQYRRLPDGNYAHSAVITLLDRDGNVAERIEGLRQPNTPMVERIHAILATPR